ncbi:MAG TPA: carboxymuconolactone decarboxylase family protein [Planctomycetes bacterium]|nr:carboxymuconolactone decarboxylase family protein [Planctomycetota bacterium]
MNGFRVHTPESAPKGGDKVLETARKKYGMIPNLLGVMVEAPVAAEAYLVLGDLFGRSSLTPAERAVVWLAVSHRHECDYCMAAHTGVATAEKVSETTIQELRRGERLSDSRLEALRQFTLQLVEERGNASERDIQDFLDAGYTRQNVFEVVIGIAHKTISNYSNHMVHTPLDAAFESFRWERA